MGCDLYTVWVEKTKVAKDLSLGYALIFAKAIMVEYYNDPDITVSIVRQRINDDANVEQ